MWGEHTLQPVIIAFIESVPPKAKENAFFLFMFTLYTLLPSIIFF